MKTYLLIGLSLLVTVSCSVISREMRAEAEPEVSFRALAGDVRSYVDKTVILGGYVLEVQNGAQETRLTVLQTPLGIGDEPKPRDFSEGRFEVVYSGFLDPEVYRKDRRVTVAGTVLGCLVQRTGDGPHPLLRVAGREIYLWPEYERRAPYPYPYYDPWHYPFRYHRYYYHR